MFPIEYSIHVPASTRFPFEVKSMFVNVKIHFAIKPKSDFKDQQLPSKEERLTISVRYKDSDTCESRIKPLSLDQFLDMQTIEPTLFEGESVFVPLDFDVQTKEIIDAFTRLSRDTLVYIMRNEDFEYHSGEEICRRLKKYFKAS
jgi:hypothetical protein